MVFLRRDTRDRHVVRRRQQGDAFVEPLQTAVQFQLFLADERVFLGAGFVVHGCFFPRSAFQLPPFRL